ncbi:MAG: glycosyltransferase family 4 protein [Gemmatimonadales bacterium]|nr:glycosyltransferase family 4 protein [Gemmatimonadales bacterium]
MSGLSDVLPNILPAFRISGSVAARVGPSRVLLVAPQPFYEDRGTPIAIRQVAEALSELGWRIDVATYPIGRPIELPNVELHRCANPLGFRHVPVGFSLRKVLLDGCLVATLRERLARQEYDCIHAVEEAAFPAALYGRQLGIPVVYDMASSLPEQLASHAAFGGPAAQAALRRCESWLLRHVDTVICSAGLAPKVREITPSTRLHQWRFSGLRPPTSLAVDSRRARAMLGIGANTQVVLYSGTFEAYQGLYDLVDAVPLILAAAPDTVFVLVGAHGAEGAAIRRRVGALGLDHSVRVLERQPRERIPPLLAMAEVLVSTRAFGGNLPLKIFDYLAAGRSIVATDIPSHRSVLSDERAMLVPSGARPLAGAVTTLLQDPDRRALLAGSARAYAAAHLGWAGFVESIEHLYDGVVARSAVR